MDVGTRADEEEDGEEEGLEVEDCCLHIVSGEVLGGWRWVGGCEVPFRRLLAGRATMWRIERFGRGGEMLYVVVLLVWRGYVGEGVS